MYISGENFVREMALSQQFILASKMFAKMVEHIGWREMHKTQTVRAPLEPGSNHRNAEKQTSYMCFDTVTKTEGDES